MNKYFVYPNPSINAYNSYIKDLCDSVNSINKNEQLQSSIKNLGCHLFDGNIYIFNWPENIIYRKHGLIQFLFFIVYFAVIMLRKVKIVWIFHNIKPHQGHNLFSKYLYSLFLKKSSLIITHSEKALDYLKGKTNAQLFYTPHPFKKFILINKEQNRTKTDIFIWGSIEKYKGIAEFLEYLNFNNLSSIYKVLIIGKCNDLEYEKRIKNSITENCIFENRFIESEELKIRINESRYVLFPYLKGSVSSSGALMDTLLLGGNVIGPNTGAFKEVEKNKICITFNNYDDIFSIIKNNINTDSENIKKYIKNNTWESFAEKLNSITIK